MEDAERVRQLMDVWYGDGPLGIPGDDDGGATSSWYVLSAIGFYPVCPGSPVYEIGSPIFAKTTIRVGNGKQFNRRQPCFGAEQVHPVGSAQRQAARTVPGSVNRTSRTAARCLEMADQPKLQWGSAPEDAPPSMSSELHR